MGWAIALLIRAVGLTLRWRLDDRAALRLDNPESPLIWVFWHNRIFALPLVYRKFLRRRHGAVLTSPSGDGDILTRVMASFGVDAVRGSSNKRPAAALRSQCARRRRAFAVASSRGVSGYRSAMRSGMR